MIRAYPVEYGRGGGVGPDEEAVVVIARSTQEAIVVNLPGLYALPADGA